MGVDRRVLVILGGMDILLISAGLGYTWYSAATANRLAVMGQALPGVVPGLLITYLGGRFAWRLRRLAKGLHTK